MAWGAERRWRSRRRGSWMADVLADDAQPLWIDPASREAILRGKQAKPWLGGAAADDDATEEEGE